MQNKIIPIAMCFNDGYVLPATAAIASVLKNAGKTDDFHFHIIYAEGRLSEENKEKIRQLSAIKPFRIDFCPINIEILKDYNFPEMSYITYEAYFRYFIPDFVRDYDKCLYLDSDILVFRSLKELYNQDISDYYSAGCLDIVITQDYLKSMNIETESGYINSGVQLMNLTKWREDNIVQKLCENTRKYADIISFADQDIINITLQGKIKLLDLKYNFPVYFYSISEEVSNYFSKKDIDSALFNLVIAHYVTGKKPWNHFGEKLQFYDDWFKYAEMTPFKEEVEKVYYKKQQVESKKEEKSFIDKIFRVYKCFRKRRIYLLSGFLPGICRLNLNNYFKKDFEFEVVLGNVR